MRSFATFVAIIVISCVLVSWAAPCVELRLMSAPRVAIFVAPGR